MLSQMYTQTMMMLRSCEIDYDNPPDASKSVIAVMEFPLEHKTISSVSLEEKEQAKVTTLQLFLLAR